MYIIWRKRLFSVVCLVFIQACASYALASSTVPFVKFCTAGNFKGTVEGEFGEDNKGKFIRTKRYKIEELWGFEHRKKANLDLELKFKGSPHRLDLIKSPNALIQDGKWRDLTLGRNTGVKGKVLDFKYKFTFDRKGPDISCDFGKFF